MNLKFKKDLSRRKFIKIAIAAIVSFELFYVLFDLVGKKKPKLNTANLFNAGNVNSFEKNKIYPFNSGLFYLSRFADGGFLAISIKCTHLGCIVNANSNIDGFTCPCHSSKFNKYGEVLSPPATRALDIYPITIANGKLKIDVNNPVKRKKYDDSQLTYI